MKLLRYMRTFRFWFALSHEKKDYDRWENGAYGNRHVYGTTHTFHIGWCWILGALFGILKAARVL